MPRPFEPKHPGMAGIQTPAASVGQSLSNTPGMGSQMTPGLNRPADNGIAGKSMSPIGQNAAPPVPPMQPPVQPPSPPGISGRVMPMEPSVGAVITPIGEQEAEDALTTLEKYRQGKAVHDQRIIREEQWYRLQQGQDGGRMPEGTPRPTSAWMLSVLMSKHADMMDNIPVPNILPREQSDEHSARILSDIVPAILDRVDFTETYSKNAWDKLKFGTACYGVFWDGSAENGLGDIAIRPVEMLNIFWEPGIDDIQKSANVFVVGYISNEQLDKIEGEGKVRGNMVLNQYVHEDYVDLQSKSVVVDWYYKKQNLNGKTVLHYAKLVGSKVLFASENDPRYSETGWYDHGLYPFILDRMTPQKDTPAGFGLISQQMDGQMYIDKLSGFILEHAAQSAHQRWWVSKVAGVNDEEFLDPNSILVHVDGAIEENRMKAIDVPSMGAYPLQVLQLKIDEMKETSANRDFNNGGTATGVTAASAIYALQESGNKVSRAIVQETYTAYTKIIRQVIELIRQFYDIPRIFRIVMPNGMAEYMSMGNAQIKGQPAGMLPDGTPLIREPVFDVKVSAQKRNPFSTAAQNELALQLYSYGFFAPGGEQAALLALDMMTFEGKDKMVEKLNQNMMQAQMMMAQQAAMGAPAEEAPPEEEPATDDPKTDGGKRPYTSIKEAKARSGNGQIS